MNDDLTSKLKSISKKTHVLTCVAFIILLILDVLLIVGVHHFFKWNDDCHSFNQLIVSCFTINFCLLLCAGVTIYAITQISRNLKQLQKSAMEIEVDFYNQELLKKKQSEWKSIEKETKKDN